MHERITTEAGFKLMHRFGTAEAFLKSDSAVLVEYTGKATGGFADEISEYLTQHFLERPFHLFVDAASLQSYETKFRQVWTDWLATHKSIVLGTHILFRSRIVEMGIGMTNAILGGTICAYSSRLKFESALKNQL